MRSKNVLRGLLCTAAAVLGLAGAASTASAQVVISQIYPGGGSSPTNGSTSGTNSTTPSNIVAATGTAEYIADFVELYNRSGQPVDVTGWTLQYGDAATGTLRQVNIGSNLANGTGNQSRVSTLNGVIQPNSYFLVQLVTPPSFAGNRGLPFPANAGAPYNLDPAGGKLVLVRPRPTLGTGAGQALAAANISAVASNLVSDAVAWGASAAVLEGANAPALTDNRFGLARKLAGCQDTGNNLNDFDVVTVGRTFVTQQPGTVALLQPRNSATAATSACAATPSLRACCNDSNGACFLIEAAAAPAAYTCPAGTSVVTNASVDSSVCSPSPCASSVACCIGQQCFVADRTLCLQTGGVVLGVVPDGTSTCSSTQCVPAPVRISQIYVSGGQTGATYRNDFVELFNAGSTPVDVSGWALQYASAGGQFTQRVDFPAVTSIPARSYFLVRLGGTSTPGAGATVTGDFNPATTYDMGASGRLALVTAATPSPFQLAICPGLPRANVADYVGWGDGVACFEGTPVGVSPGPVTALYRVVNGCTDTDRNFNDFVANALTPTLRTTANSFDCSTVATLPGACCAGNLTCSLTTSAACAGSFLGEGTVCSSTTATTPNACGTPIGRCCIALQSCTATLTEQQCRDAAIAAGLADYVSFSVGSTCSSGSGSTLVSNLCVGVCCTGAACTLTTRELCVGDTAFWASNTQGIQGVGSNPVTCSTNICQTPVAAQAGDIVYGASVSQNYDSAVQYRDTGSGPVRVGTLTRYNNVQYFAFDNSFNSPKNARGNLLAMDFGTVGGGATIFNVATNGSINAGQVLYRLQAGNALNPYNLPTGRYASLAVSPNNRYVATLSYDASRVAVLRYDAGSTPGTGAGASFTAGFTIGDPFGFLPNQINFSPLFSGACVWLNDSTLAILVRNANPGFTTGAALAPVLITIPFNDGSVPGVPEGFGTPQYQVAIPDGGIDSSRVMSIAYNPAVSPFLYCTSSAFAGSTTNVFSVIDPRQTPWRVMAGVGLTASLQTARSVVLGNDKFLYFSQFAGSGQNTGAPLIDRLNLDRNNDGTIDTGSDPQTNVDIIAIPDNLGSFTSPADPDQNTTVDYILKTEGQQTNAFNSLEIALTNSTGTPANVVCCRGVTCATIAAAACTAPAGVGVRVLGASITSCAGQSALNSGCCYADFNKSGDKDVADIFAFLSAWFANSPFSDVGGDGTGTRDVSDIFQFLSAWFAGCT